MSITFWFGGDPFFGLESLIHDKYVAPLQVVVCSFVHGSSKTKTKQLVGAKGNEVSEAHHSNKLATPPSASSTQNYAPSAASIWPVSRSIEMRNPHTGIDLTRG